MAGSGPRARRFTRVEYDRLIDAGFFRPDDPVELLGGQLIVAEPQGSRHYAALRATHEAVRAAFGPGWEIRGQGPLALDDESEPEPDVAVVPGSFRDYRAAHPSRPVLVIEIDPIAPFGWRYRSTAILAEWAATTPLALPDRPIAVRDMLG
jgi:hypothetical protein